MATEQKNDMGGVIGTDPYLRGDQMQPTLPEEMLERITPLGSIRAVEEGECLFSVGDQQVPFIVVLSGELSIEVPTCEGTDRIVGHRRGNFTGEIDMFSNRRAVVNGRCTEAGEMLFLDREAFRTLLGTQADLSEMIIRAFILRRTGLIYHQRGDLVLIGPAQSPDMLTLRNFLSRNGHPHRLEDPTTEDGEIGKKLIDVFSLSEEDLPAALYRNEKLLKRPTRREVADLLGLSEPSGVREIYDVAVVGVGPAGLAAAVNAAAEGLSVVAFEQLAPGGQAGTSSKIENYPAFPTGISGQALGARMMLQAQKFGTEILTPRAVSDLCCKYYPYTVSLDDGDKIRAKSVVIATGARWRRLGLDNEQAFENAGIYYGATAMEASHCAGQEVVIVGGGNSAGQAAVYLANHASCVRILIRRESLVETMSDYLIKRIDADPRISLHPQTELVNLEGNGHLQQVTWRNNATGETETKPIKSVFVMIGAIPNTHWLGDTLLTDDKGFILTGSDLPTKHLVTEQWHVTRMPFIGETSQPGVFAVGDVRSGSVKRVASAVGEGAISAQFLYRVVNPAT